MVNEARLHIPFTARRWSRENADPAERPMVERARAGDQGAAEELARLWWPKAYGVALGILGDPSSASDVAQEAVIAALTNIARLDPSRPAAPWIRRIATNKALDWIRTDSRRPAPTEPTDQPQRDDTGDLHELVEVLSGFPHDVRAMLVLHHLGGYSSKEIAEIIGTRPGTVRSAMSRALATLRDSNAGVLS